MNSMPRSIALQKFIFDLRALPTTAKLSAIESRLGRMISLYEIERVMLLRNIYYSDIYNLNKMFKTTMVSLAQEILGVNDRYSMSGIGAQLSQRCRDIYMATRDKENGDMQIIPLMGAWHILCAFPDQDLTMVVE